MSDKMTMEKVEIRDVVPIIKESPHLHTVYVDGLTQVMVGMPNSKLRFHADFAAEGGEGAPTRTVVAELVIPTSSMLDMASKITDIARQVGKEMERLHGVNGAALDIVLKKLGSRSDSAAPSGT